LAVAAAAARGRTVMRGLAELRIKESDRLAAIARGLTRAGIEVESLDDGLVIHGKGEGAAVPGGTLIETQMDHRIAMAFLVLGLASAAPIAIDDARMIATSFPGFADLMRGLGARLDGTP
jgi:3-phosphoshikimate 1-carboxyvinyltransferase